MCVSVSFCFFVSFYGVVVWVYIMFIYTHAFAIRMMEVVCEYGELGECCLKLSLNTVQWHGILVDVKKKKNYHQECSRVYLRNQYNIGVNMCRINVVS